MEYINIEIDGKIVNLPEPCSFNVTKNDLTDNKFDIDKWTARTKIIDIKIYLLKQTLAKYKEDVEQVELFGMERTDYEEKKKLCADMILELRELEKQLKGE